MLDQHVAVEPISSPAQAILQTQKSFGRHNRNIMVELPRKQNSLEAKPLGCEHLVGVRRFELLTSSVSGKRSPPELNAQMERTTGLEPATPTLARLCSTN